MGNFDPGKREAVLEHAFTDTVCALGQRHSGQVVTLCKQIVTQLYLFVAGGK